MNKVFFLSLLLVSLNITASQTPLLRSISAPSQSVITTITEKQFKELSAAMTCANPRGISLLSPEQRTQILGETVDKLRYELRKDPRPRSRSTTK